MMRAIGLALAAFFVSTLLAAWVIGTGVMLLVLGFQVLMYRRRLK